MLQKFQRKKLKKKWRFWRLFKRFFLKRKKLKMFPRLAWIFNQKRVIWHNLYTLYGREIKKLKYKKTQTKFLFGIRFFKVLAYFELRLDILLVRLGWVSSRFVGVDLINKGNILINGKTQKNSHFLVKIGDIIQKTLSKPLKKRFFLLKWRKFKWNRWRRYSRKFKINAPRAFWLFKKNLTVNFLEVNYKIFSCIALRQPLAGEVLLDKQKRLWSTKILKKIYFLY